MPDAHGRSKQYPEFGDEDLMFFGKWNGHKLKNVAPNYLLWWFRESIGRSSPSGLRGDQLKLFNYIMNRLDHIKKEANE